MKDDLSSLHKKWQAKSDWQKTRAVNNGFTELRKIAREQIKIITKQKNNKDFKKSSRHHFIFHTIISFWRDADFAYSLRRKKWNFYVVYPIRTMMEKKLRMTFFLQKSTVIQEDMANKELLLSAKRIYDFHKVVIGRATNERKKWYRSLNERDIFPDIDKVKDSDLKAFLPIERLCENQEDYQYFRYLSGVPHGQLGYTMFLDHTGKTEYRRLMMFGNILCYKMLKLTDSYLGKSMNTDIEDAYQKVKNLIIS